MPDLANKYVCPGCIEEPAIQAHIREIASSTNCSYCGEEYESVCAAPIVNVADHMKDCIQKEYDDAANCLPFETAEGGWQGAENWKTCELLQDILGIDFPNDRTGELQGVLVERIGLIDWCHRDPFGPTDYQIVKYGWEDFCEVIKYVKRFFFMGEQEPPNETDETLADLEKFSPSQFLQSIFNHAVTVELFDSLPNETKLFRARYQKPGTALTTAQDLGPPPRNSANQTNRMSPPGIVMFYASDDPETALRETANNPGTFVIGTFETKREAVILDLTNLPPIPSLFENVSDALEYEPRRVLTFLHYVIEEISKPIARDEKVHVEYVPTQVVTEFIRTQCQYDGKNIDGIRYPSGVHLGGNSIVLFANQDNILPAPPDPYPGLQSNQDRWLELTGHSNFEVTETVMRSWNSGPIIV